VCVAVCFYVDFMVVGFVWGCIVFTFVGVWFRSLGRSRVRVGMLKYAI